MKLIFGEKKTHPIRSSNKHQNRLQNIQLLSTRTQRESQLKVIKYPNNILKTHMVTKLRRKYFGHFTKYFIEIEDSLRTILSYL